MEEKIIQIAVENQDILFLTSKGRVLKRHVSWKHSSADVTFLDITPNINEIKPS